ncbi:ATP-binding protein [Desulfuromonas thiophila]|uniref:PD-(D/E)XK nuclease superfamily protein n=1 Tax=Desulfuromonas thiophila TaxID=57664 RepID=A0A1G7ET14_9BACT|nr:ATP-binding protein [Desulfuromonas thiophila]SDE66759.1 PD-(D/E)XK nuclease superfamily protein [Desulfuromonas thiophila]
MTALKKLPIGIQTFSEIRQEGYLYVDKTPQVRQLVEQGKYYFLARPRRFGKSLLVSTLQALFEGRKELFSGLAIEPAWDWDSVYPVIKISFGGVARDLADMKQDVAAILRENQERLGISCPPEDDAGSCFKYLIRHAARKYGQKVVILVDEYDKLIVDNLDQPGVASQGREVLRDLYTTIKDSDEHVKFAFLTGVSKFSKVSVFSGLNNLEDISLNPTYATLCGYTQHDLETTFAAHLQGADMAQVRQWYNGYNFLGERVYNPFDILLFIKNDQRFENYWFATGTPSFLIKLIRQSNYYVPKLNNLHVSRELIDSFDIDNIRLEPLLFQTGYLTIKDSRQTDFGSEYRLGLPNREVSISFNDQIIRYLTDSSDVLPVKKELLASLRQQDLAQFDQTLRGLFASIPYNNYVNNTISSYEGYYASVIYAYLASLGLDLTAEDVTSKGRIDLSLRLDTAIYLIEFKVDGGGKALEQIRQRNYQQKYQGQGKPIYLIGIDFDSAERNLTAFDWEQVS